MDNHELMEELRPFGPRGYVIKKVILGSLHPRMHQMKDIDQVKQAMKEFIEAYPQKVLCVKNVGKVTFKLILNWCGAEVPTLQEPERKKKVYSSQHIQAAKTILKASGYRITKIRKKSK